MSNQPYPDLDQLLKSIGEAGKRVSDLGACEGASGNISICCRWQMNLKNHFPLVEEIDLPQSVPSLAGAILLVTGSGRRLREIIDNPCANLGCVVINPGGETAKLHTSPLHLFTKLTSEFNSHLAVHANQALNSADNFHALIHAQPPHLTYLTHVRQYQDEVKLNKRLFRWQPETIMMLPEGLGYVPFISPGSKKLSTKTVASLEKHRIVVWGKHGVMVSSHHSMKQAVDYIEYVETAARYETINLLLGEIAEGLSDDDIRQICHTFQLDTLFFGG